MLPTFVFNDHVAPSRLNGVLRACQRQVATLFLADLERDWELVSPERSFASISGRNDVLLRRTKCLGQMPSMEDAF